MGSGRKNGYDEADTEGTQNGFGGEVHSVRVQRSLMEAVRGLAGRTQLCTVIKRHPSRNLSKGARCSLDLVARTRHTSTRGKRWSTRGARTERGGARTDNGKRGSRLAVPNGRPIGCSMHGCAA